MFLRVEVVTVEESTAWQVLLAVDARADRSMVVSDGQVRPPKRSPVLVSVASMYAYVQKAMQAVVSLILARQQQHLVWPSAHTSRGSCGRPGNNKFRPDLDSVQLPPPGFMA